LAKIKIYEIAKELNVDNKSIIDAANKIGLAVKSHLSAIEEDEAKKIRDTFTPKAAVKEEKKVKSNNNEIARGPVIIRREVIVNEEKATPVKEKPKNNIGFNSARNRSNDYNIVYREKQAKPMSVNELFGIKPKKEEPKKEESHPSSPLAKVILKENSIDSDKVTGTGVGGKITKEDAIKAVAAMGRTQGNRKQTVTKLSVLRRKLAARLVSVKNETAMLTTFNEVDMSEIFRLRKLYKEKFSQKHGVGLGFMSFFTKAVTRALKLYPDVNAAIDGDQKINYDFCDISVAVSGPKGLMVPIIRDAETLSFKGIELKIKDLATKVRDGNISVDEMTGGTFTITNGGTFGSMLSTPIINPPQSAILGMHNILERPVAVNGQVEIRPMMYLALSYDHRIIDGRESVGFLVAVKEAIENPVELLMENNEKKALEL